MEGVTTLLNFILSLIGDEEAAAAFNDDPEGSLSAAGLSDVTAGDVQNLLPLVADYTPALGAHAASAGLGAAGLTVAVAAPNAVTPSFADDAEGPVSILQTFIQNYTADTINAHNMWADGDVTQAFAYGEHAIAAGGDVEEVVQANGEGSFAAGGDIEEVVVAEDDAVVIGGDVEESTIASGGSIAAGEELEIETDGGHIITGGNNAIGDEATAVGGDQYNVEDDGQINQAGGDVIHAEDDAVVAGGNVNQAEDDAVISGGDTNQAEDDGVIAGGDVTQAEDDAMIARWQQHRGRGRGRWRDRRRRRRAGNGGNIAGGTIIDDNTGNAVGGGVGETSSPATPATSSAATRPTTRASTPAATQPPVTPRPRAAATTPRTMPTSSAATRPPTAASTPAATWLRTMPTWSAATRPSMAASTPAATWLRTMPTSSAAARPTATTASTTTGGDVDQASGLGDIVGGDQANNGGQISAARSDIANDQGVNAGGNGATGDANAAGNDSNIAEDDGQRS